LIEHYRSNLIGNKNNIPQVLEPIKILLLNIRIAKRGGELRENMG
jgi:hypothetical protein